MQARHIPFYLCIQYVGYGNSPVVFSTSKTVVVTHGCMTMPASHTVQHWCVTKLTMARLAIYTVVQPILLNHILTCH